MQIVLFCLLGPATYLSYLSVNFGGVTPSIDYQDRQRLPIVRELRFPPLGWVAGDDSEQGSQLANGKVSCEPSSETWPGSQTFRL